jgi:hypothetical protein
VVEFEIGRLSGPACRLGKGIQLQKVMLIVVALVAVFAATEFVPVLMSNFAPLSGGPVHGVVTDASSNRPLPGALVIVHWIGRLSGSHGPRYPCYYVALAQTDEKGIFNVPQWKMSRDAGPGWLRGMSTDNFEKPIEIHAYKPGYVFDLGPMAFATNEEISLRMAPFSGTVQARLGYLFSPFEGNAKCDVDNKTLIPLYQAMYDEARASARTPSELDLVDHFLVALENAQFGNEEALTRAGRRQIDRIKALKK